MHDDHPCAGTTLLKTKYRGADVCRVVVNNISRRRQHQTRGIGSRLPNKRNKTILTNCPLQRRTRGVVEDVVFPPRNRRQHCGQTLVRGEVGHLFAIKRSCARPCSCAATMMTSKNMRAISCALCHESWPADPGPRISATFADAAPEIVSTALWER